MEAVEEAVLDSLFISVTTPRAPVRFAAAHNFVLRALPAGRRPALTDNRTTASQPPGPGVR
jgi:hypothetical protein